MFENFHLFANIIALGLAGIFALDSFIHIAAPGFFRKIYSDAGYSKSFLNTAAVALALTATLLFFPQVRVWGGILGGVILFAMTTSLLFRERYVLAIPTILLLAAIPPAMA